jgi:hypothetical protein
MVRELYYKFTYEMVIDQFDSNYIERHARTLHKPHHQTLYDKFKEFLKSMNEEELKVVMKFITGAEIIPASPKIKVYFFLIKYFC